MFNLLTGINTTHWGLKVQQRYYDLKRIGYWPFARTDFEPLDQHSRDKREVIETIRLGKTHFSDSEIVQIGKTLESKNYRVQIY